MIDPLEPRRLFATTGLDPSYGTNGQFTLPVAAPVEGAGAPGNPASGEASNLITSVFTQSGAAYLLVNEPTGAHDDYGNALAIDSVYRLTSDGRLDTAFGDNGHVVTSRPYYSSFSGTLAVSARGRVFVNDVGPGKQLIDADGRILYGAGKRLRSMQNGLQPSDMHGAAFDDAGRLYLAGGFKTPGKQTYVYGVTRYTSDGRLDATWASKGFANASTTPDADSSYPGSLENVQTQIAIAADGRVAATFSYGNTLDPYGDGRMFITTADIHVLQLAADGSRVGLTPVANAEDSFGQMIFSKAYDLRAVTDGTFVAYTDGFQDRPGATAVRIAADGTSKATLVGDNVSPPDLRTTPVGTAVGSPSLTETAYRAFFPAVGRSDDSTFVGSYTGLGVLNDGRLMDATIVSDGDDRRLVVRRFDGTGRTTAAPAGTAVVRVNTRTLDVAGTSDGDLIRVRYHAGRVAVRINDRPTRRFSVRDFDTITIHGEAGGDGIDVRLAGVPRAIRVLGGAGQDTILADHSDATLDGGADDDALRGPGYLDGGDGDDRLDGTGLLRGGPGDDMLLTHRRGVSVPVADD